MEGLLSDDNLFRSGLWGYGAEHDGLARRVYGCPVLRLDEPLSFLAGRRQRFVGVQCLPRQRRHRQLGPPRQPSLDPPTRSSSRLARKPAPIHRSARMTSHRVLAMDANQTGLFELPGPTPPCPSERSQRGRNRETWARTVTAEVTIVDADAVREALARVEMDAVTIDLRDDPADVEPERNDVVRADAFDALT